MTDKQPETPIIDALVAHAMREKVSLHVPGHHQGRALPAPLQQWLGQATKLDATELPGLDNLHHAVACIQASERYTAGHYGSRRCFYSVNGATACVMAAIAACVQSTGKSTVLMLGPCHVSAWRGLVYADAEALFVPSPWREDLSTFGPPDVRQLADALAVEDDIAAVFVTSPTYQGLVAPVQALVEVAHRHGVPVIVDEAHGAHFGLVEGLPRHSVQEGADVVVQSPHKTLPCLTQAAWVHLNGTLVEEKVLEERLLFLQTTSPSYLLLASLDGAQAWLRGEGPSEATRTLSRLGRYPRAKGPDLEVDPMRWWIPTGSASRSQQLDGMLQSRGVFTEFADAFGVLAIFGFAQPDHEYRRFFEVLQQWREDEVAIPSERTSVHAIYQLGNRTRTVLRPREVAQRKRVSVPLAQARGRILAAPVAPYPPGVAALWPGQEITGEQVACLAEWISHGGVVVGIDDREQLEVIE
ncbi:aminotransferase class I/II-fold pyridoxal phosphate-dependent enzyme [Alicyclobacillus fastidiosus]|uniref:Aminotransferase class I/II-fold pyridoxal phosphate-dependent enzyme n=1 Tax=Alicyclobacillus fastidiosus TaxID=392011 RepID=A0ABV5AE02_9BACL|nr:aminotransferase class I/II-fold pyridoxal phosphate-dependent enzyme [Alicyclobacillus fastidiosus]WEH09908.1 aminotransferase class I/II-fold pyridoxal phosphate-dependent enzyme [Alicyclobacillus fastidiosus]